MARRRLLGEILQRAQLLDDDGLRRALERQRRRGGRLGQHLVDLGLIEEATLIRALSAQLGIKAVSLEPADIDPRVAGLVPRALCERHRIVCFAADPGERLLHVAMVEPLDSRATAAVQEASGWTVRAYLGARSAIDRVLAELYGVAERSAGLAAPDGSAAAGAAGAWRPGVTPLHRVGRGRPVVVGDVSLPPGTEERDIERMLPPPEPPPPSARTLRAAQIEEVALPELNLDESFHISVETAALDDRAGAPLGDAAPVDREPMEAQSRLEALEVLVERQSALLRLLLGALVTKGVLSREDVDAIVERLRGA